MAANFVVDATDAPASPIASPATLSWTGTTRPVRPALSARAPARRCSRCGGRASCTRRPPTRASCPARREPRSTPMTPHTGAVGTGSGSYTEPGRTRLAPQVEIELRRGGTRFTPLGLSSAEAGTNAGVVPSARPGGCLGGSTPAPRSPQSCRSSRAAGGAARPADGICSPQSPVGGRTSLATAVTHRLQVRAGTPAAAGQVLFPTKDTSCACQQDGSAR